LILFAPLTDAQDYGSREETYRDVANDLTKIQDLIDSAQKAPLEKIPRQLVVTAEKAELRKGAMETTPKIAEASEGKLYSVIDKASNWYAVQLEEPIAGQSVAWVSAASVAPMVFFDDIEYQIDSFTNGIYEKILNQINSFKDKYKNNPYVNVSGFSINIGTNISATVSFEFKE
jgi:hypothetical protein